VVLEVTPQHYRIEPNNRVLQFLKKHVEFAEKQWPRIVQALAIRPYQGSQITHLKGQLHCSRRWRAGIFRVLYDVSDEDKVVYVFDAGERRDIYR
jgi:mRNA-degrading endonuclease RelE of RelBE toxin-antitoxin system